MIAEDIGASGEAGQGNGGTLSNLGVHSPMPEGISHQERAVILGG